MENPGLSDTNESYLIFLIAGKEYGVNVKILSSVINPLQNYSLGESFNIINNSIRVNNQEIPLFDFYDLFNITPPPQSKYTRIIIVIGGTQKAAFYVEQVKGTVFLPINKLLQSKHSSTPSQPFIKWQIKFSQREILFPDFDKIFLTSQIDR